MRKINCYACDRDSEEGVWIDGGDWTFYCSECFAKYEKEFPCWEHAKKRYVTKDSDTDEQ